MSTPRDPDLKLQEEQFERIFHRFSARSADFRKLFAGLVAFGLVFYFLILVPSLTIQGRSRDLQHVRELQTQEAERRDVELNVYRTALQGIRTIRERFIQSPDSLRAFLGMLEPPAELISPGLVVTDSADSVLQGSSPIQQMASLRRAPMIQQAPAPPDLDGGECEGAATLDQWVDCMVRRRVAADFAVYDSILQADVLPLLSLADSAAATRLRGFGSDLEMMETRFADALDQSADFWTTYQGKEGFFRVQLTGALDDFWGRYGSFADSQTTALAARIQQLHDTLTTLDAQLDSLRSEEARVAARVEQIEFPFGKLPIGLSEALAIFPLILGLAFFACAAALSESIRLGSACRDLLRTRDPAAVALTPSQIALITPLWLDPDRHPAELALKFAALLVPLAIAFLAGVQLILAWDLRNAGSVAALSQSALFALLGVSALLFIAGYVLVLRTIMNPPAPRSVFPQMGQREKATSSYPEDG
jgi:hypothetical protein